MSKEKIVKMSLNVENTASLMSILSKMYVNPEYAVVREYIANAMDAITGVENGKVTVKFPTQESKGFAVKDSGTGMSRDKLSDMFSVFGLSESVYDDEKTGGFGIGSKSAFAITDKYYVESVFNGKLNRLKASSKDGGVFSFDPEEDTDNPNGTTVVINEFSSMSRVFPYEIEELNSPYTYDFLHDVGDHKYLEGIGSYKVNVNGQTFANSPFFGFESQDINVLASDYLFKEHYITKNDVIVWENDDFAVMKYAVEGSSRFRRVNLDDSIFIAVGKVVYRYEVNDKNMPSLSDMNAKSESKTLTKNELNKSEFLREVLKLSGLTVLLKFHPKQIELTPSRDNIMLTPFNETMIQKSYFKAMTGLLDVPKDVILSNSNRYEVEFLPYLYKSVIEGDNLDKKINMVMSLTGKFQFKDYKISNLEMYGNHDPHEGQKTNHKVRFASGPVVLIDDEEKFNYDYFKELRRKTKHDSPVRFVKASEIVDESHSELNTAQKAMLFYNHLYSIGNDSGSINRWLQNSIFPYRQILQHYTNAEIDTLARIYPNSTNSFGNGNRKYFMTEDEYLERFGLKEEDLVETEASLMINEATHPLVMINPAPRRVNMLRKIGSANTQSVFVIPDEFDNLAIQSINKLSLMNMQDSIMNFEHQIGVTESVRERYEKNKGKGIEHSKNLKLFAQLTGISPYGRHSTNPTPQNTFFIRESDVTDFKQIALSKSLKTTLYDATEMYKGVNLDEITRLYGRLSRLTSEVMQYNDMVEKSHQIQQSFTDGTMRLTRGKFRGVSSSSLILNSGIHSMSDDIKDGTPNIDFSSVASYIDVFSSKYLNERNALADEAVKVYNKMFGVIVNSVKVYKIDNSISSGGVEEVVLNISDYTAKIDEKLKIKIEETSKGLLIPSKY